MTFYLAVNHFRSVSSARSPLYMPTGFYRRMMTTFTTRSSTLSAGVSQIQPCSFPWRRSETGDRQRMAAAAAYTLLEERLLVAPLCPNDALDTLLCLVSAGIHHKGVVDHLVHIVSGNACCLDPSLCLAVMERLLAPALPIWLLGQAVGSENNTDEKDWTPSEINDAALLMALAPLGRVLSRCVAVHARLELVRKGHITDSLCRLRGCHMPHAGPLCVQLTRESEADDRSSRSLLRGAAVLMSFTAQRRHWDYMDSERDAVMSGCAVQHREPRESGDRWHACALTVVVYPVLYHLFSAQSQENERERGAARRRDSSSFSTTAVLEPSRSSKGGQAPFRSCAADPSRWGTVRSLGQKCWWWSTLICRATPAIALVGMRTFVVFSLVNAVHELHRTLAQCVVPGGSPLLCSCSEHPPQPTSSDVLPCLAMLEWLLVNSVHVLHDAGDEHISWRPPPLSKTTAQSSRPPAWTAELRRGWWHLGLDFARLSAAALEPGAHYPGAAYDENKRAVSLSATVGMVRLDSICACARSHLVRAMANVGYRLALQWTAVVSPSATVIGVTKLVRERLYSEPRCNALRQSGFPTEDRHQGRQEVLPVCELLVILRLLGAITTLRPVLSRAAPPTIDTLSSEVDVVFVDESTWSKLACLVNLVRCCPTDRAEGGDRRADAAPAAAAAQGSNAGRTDGVSPIIDAIREHQKFLQLHEERLLLCGMTHALACAATSTQKAASCDTEGAIVATDTAVLGYHTTGLRSSAHTTAPALPDVSAEFVCALMKFWRTWTDDWPLELHAAWLQKLASIVASVEAAVSTGMEGAYGKGGAGGSTSPTGSTAEQAGVQVGVSSSPWFELPSDQCDHQCLLVQRQLCSALNEAWATMTDAWHDSDPLDMCACWYAFSATSRKPRCPSLTEMSSSSRAGAQPSSRCASSRLSQQLSLMATACEDRFCCMCETWLRRLRDLPSTAIMSSILQSRERRPMLRNSALGRRQGHASLGIGWCPVCLPAIVSQVALRVLYRGTPKYAPNAAGATPIGSSAAAEPLCISDAFLDVVRRAILAPATEELAAFQLSVVSRYVGWCEAAGVHVGWCACAVQAHRTAAAADVSNSWGMSFQDLVGKPPSAPSMPWWVLTVDGLAVGGGVQSSVNIATILFLWEHGVDAAVATRVTVPAAGSKASCFIGPRHHHHLSGHTSSIRPLMSPQLDTAGSGTTEESCSTSPGVIGLGTLRAPSKAATEWGEEESDDCDGSADEHLRMRRCIVEWGHRYALRLVLLEVLGDGWQRSRDAVLADLSQRQLPGQALCAAWRGTSGALTVARKVTVEGHAKTSDGESVVPGATSAYRTALSGLDITPRFVWHSDAYQPLVCLVADNAARMVDQLAAEVLAVASSTVVPPHSRDSHAKAAGPRAAVQFTGASSMRSLVMDKHPEQWRARIVAHLWSALRDSPVHATTSGPSPLSLSDHGTITPFSDSRVPPAAARYSLWRHQQPRGVVSSDAVVRLERLLAHLGLAPLSKREVARHAPCGIMSFEDVAEESLALLNSLLLCPELVCTSPRVTSYLNTVLWQRCWACLMRASRAVFDDRMGGRPASLDGFDNMAAQLDVLVTFRTILFTLDRMQQLVQELVEYLCCVFVPAVQTDRCAAWMVETPVETISRLARTHSLSDSDTVSSQTTRPQHTVTSKEDTGNARDRRRMFCFSAAAVRTFEVLCLGRRGGEQRAQRVWQQWTRDLICEDRILRQHPLLRST